MLAPVIEGLRRAQTGVDKTVAELAIVRLMKEIFQQAGSIRHLETAPFNYLYPSSQVGLLLYRGSLVSSPR